MKVNKIEKNGKTFCNVDTVADRDFLIDNGIDVDAVEAEVTANIEAEKAKEFAKMNCDYNGTNISITSKDSLGLLQVQSAFNLGLKSTKFVFENGTMMELKAKDFTSFATFFVTERNKLFT